jgi:putative membrane protein
MMLRWLLASFHLLGLGVGLGAVWVRGRGLKGPLDTSGLRRVFRADSLWGLAALLWIGTGLWRLLAGTEKPTGYYLHNHIFMTKMGLLIAILVLELWPMTTLLRWRARVGQGEVPDTAVAPLLARISFTQAWIVVLMVFAATAMARGMNFSPGS